MAFQFETGAFRQPALVPHEPERRCRPLGTAKHPFQKLVGARAGFDPGVLILAGNMIHMPLHGVPVVDAVVAMT
jgi:hypothetical protein